VTAAIDRGTREDALAAARAALDKQALDVVILDVHATLVITDLFVLATGTSDRQVRTVVDAIDEAMRARGRRPFRREGEEDRRWVLLDYVDLVVHVFAQEEREFYDLERLWGDAPRIPVPDAATPSR
jgi:ribosome-associated protein